MIITYEIKNPTRQFFYRSFKKSNMYMIIVKDRKYSYGDYLMKKPFLFFISFMLVMIFFTSPASAQTATRQLNLL